MKFREAMLFSNGKVRYNSEDNKSRIEVQERQEEYIPMFNLKNEPGPFYRSVYIVNVARVPDEPHKSFSFYSIERCEGFFEEWNIKVEDGWYIVEKE